MFAISFGGLVSGVAMAAVGWSAGSQNLTFLGITLLFAGGAGIDRMIKSL